MCAILLLAIECKCMAIIELTAPFSIRMGTRFMLTLQLEHLSFLIKLQAPRHLHYMLQYATKCTCWQMLHVPLKCSHSLSWCFPYFL